jgi:hypothetical protein
MLIEPKIIQLWQPYFNYFFNVNPHKILSVIMHLILGIYDDAIDDDVISYMVPEFFYERSLPR